MKTKFLLITLLITSLSVFSQNLPDVAIPNEKFNPEKDVIPFVIIDEAPRFKKCKKITGEELKKCFENQLDDFINDELKYPEPYKKDTLTARVYVTFKINRKGEIIDIYTRSNLKGKELFEKEIKRIINAIPKLKAGKYKGEKVTTTYSKAISISPE
ncbi:MAG: energy transducer TonB [Nonlabens sp.]|uniref:energy transducer TonB n=1 Tax=Nonlabens sp. TaxID=1888209 RepID=UPI00321B1C47